MFWLGWVGCSPQGFGPFSACLYNTYICIYASSAAAHRTAKVETNHERGNSISSKPGCVCVRLWWDDADVYRYVQTVRSLYTQVPTFIPNFQMYGMSIQIYSDDGSPI